MTENDVRLVVADRLLEPGGLQLGLITSDQFHAYFLDALADFCRSTGIVKLFSTQTVNNGQSKYIFADRLINVESVFTSGRFVPRSNLNSIDNSQFRWRNKVGPVKAFHEDGLPIKTLEAVPAPDWQGTLVTDPSGYEYLDASSAPGTIPASERNLTVYGSQMSGLTEAATETVTVTRQALMFPGSVTRDSPAFPAGLFAIADVSQPSTPAAIFPELVCGIAQHMENPRFHFFRGHPAVHYAMLSPVADGSTFHMSVWKSVDGDATWTRLDEANEPPGFVYGSAWDEQDSVWAVYSNTPPPGTSNLIVRRFDLNSEKWQADSGDTIPRDTITTYNNQPVSLVFLSDGTIRMFYVSTDSSILQAPVWLKCADTDGTTWGAPASLVNFSPATLIRCYAQHQPRSFTDNSIVDVTHVWMEVYGPEAFPYIRVGADKSVSSLFNGPAGVTGAYGNGLFDKASNGMAKPFTETHGILGNTPVVYRGTPLENPIWTREYILPIPTGDDANAYPDGHFLFPGLDGSQVSVWAGADVSNPAHQWDLLTAFWTARYNPAAPGQGWSTPSLLYSAITNPYPDAYISFDPLVNFNYWLEEFTATTTGTRTVQMIPDSAIMYLAWACLAKIYSDNSELKDAQKAMYATARYQEGVGLFRAILEKELADDPE